MKNDPTKISWPIKVIFWIYVTCQVVVFTTGTIFVGYVLFNLTKLLF